MGLPPEEIYKLIPAIWPEIFELRTANGTWIGFAASKMQETSADTCRFDRCLLVHLDGAQCISAAVVSVTGNDSSAVVEGMIDTCGEPLPANLIAVTQVTRTLQQKGGAT